jgi:hypothetical protein
MDRKMHHASHYRDFLRKLNHLYKQCGLSLRLGLNSFDLEWMSVQICQNWAALQTEASDEAASLCSNFPRAGASLLNLRLPPRERIR